VAPRASFQPVLRRFKAELVEEDLRKLLVVVLAGVQHDLLRTALLEREGERGRLDELRPVADDGKDSQADSECNPPMPLKIAFYSLTLAARGYGAGKTVAWYLGWRLQRV
jgi:hypothetical protein